MKIWIVFVALLFATLEGKLPPIGEEVLALVKQQSAANWEQEVKTIDQVVDKLSDLRNKELARASWAQNQGDRLQFQSNNLTDARRYWNEADKSREIAARYQEEIDKLEARKKEILENQGIKYYPPESK